MKIMSWIAGDEAASETEFLDRYVKAALWVLAFVVVIATVTGQVESFNGLYNWFSTHHVTGIWADFAPLAVDSFTIIGELAIFAGIARRWDWRSRVLPWISAVIGIAASVAANVGDKVQYHSVPTDITGAVFPVAGAFGIIIGLGVLKRVAKDVTMKQKLARETELPASILEAPEAPDPTRHADVQDATSAGPHYGLDVLIPPKDSWAGIVQPQTGPMPAVNEARDRQRAHPRYDRGLVQTGEIPVIS